MTARRSLTSPVAVIAACIALTVSLPVPAAEVFDIGLAASGARIDAGFVGATAESAPTVLLVGGLNGDAASAAQVRRAATDYEDRATRDFHLLFVPLANPDGVALQFPPGGTAYRENSESHALWRWIGTQAPDLMLIAGTSDFGLAAALSGQPAAGVGTVPSRPWTGADTLNQLQAADIPMSDAHREMARRRTRSPRQLAEELARVYGQDFNQPWYIEAIALIARLELGHLDVVQGLAEPWVNGERDSLARPNALVMAGHIVFTELARRTGDPRYVELVRRVADLGFEADGSMREAMPYHGEYSDSVFMGSTIAAQAGALTGERRYHDMAARHLAFMQTLVLRPDGLYRHQPATDAAWGRGNAFAALGLALTLSSFPEEHPAHARILDAYRAHMARLLEFQNRDGLWRNVVDHPGAYPEFSATAMIGFSMLRGLRNGWLSGAGYQAAVERAWQAVAARVGDAGELIDVCESTARMESLEAYLQRAAILGPDPRGGAMAMLFATELMK